MADRTMTPESRVELHVAIQILLQFVGPLITLVGIVALAWSRMTARIDAAAADGRARDEAIAKDTQAEVDALHKRVNEVRDNYVRRDDWAEALRRIEQGQRDAASEISRMRQDQRSSATTLAAIAAKIDDIAARAKAPPPAQGDD